MKKATSREYPQRYTRFCGIDVAKRKHVACIIDQDGAFVARSQAFNNDAEGYQRILARLKEAGGPKRVIIAMVVKNGEHRAALVSGELAMTCRQLTRLRYALVRQGARIKQLLWARLHPVWPEYEALFVTPFCVTGRKLLATAPTPADVLALGEQPLAELIHTTSRGMCGPARAEAVHRAALTSVGSRRGLDGARIAIRTLIRQMEALQSIRGQLEAEIEALVDQLPSHILTLPGADPISAVSLFGETDPIEAFATPSQLVAFTGLDLVVFQTGDYGAPAAASASGDHPRCVTHYGR